ncbi:Leucine-zipper-like transcriptional regulator 1 [Durusdinium trenchii]|uniref:Leucine-zipper-like transcriptional regulator 1 n=1 Tax=Durusdinium trenchii TaxID=1381693 RepID=A0ABP0KDF2_9DINO
MGKKRKDSDDDKKKKKKDKDKKKKEKKKKEKKKAKKEKKKSSSSSSSSSDADAAKPEDVLKEKAAGLATATAAATEAEAPPVNLDSLPPVEEGILRFEFSIEEVGPLGLRFSGGSPPMILSVAPDSFAKKKAIPANHEVRAINGLALLPQNQQRVMQFLKGRPLVLDVRPVGWKPPEKVKEPELQGLELGADMGWLEQLELKRKQAAEEAERQAKMAVEKKRREQVAKEQAEEAQRQAVERQVREEKERIEREEMLARARELHKEQREKEEETATDRLENGPGAVQPPPPPERGRAEVGLPKTGQEFRKALNSEPPELRKAAEDIMEADYDAPFGRLLTLPALVNEELRALRVFFLGTCPDANSWPLGVAMVCYAPRRRRPKQNQTPALQGSHRRRQALWAAAEETGLGRCIVRLALPTIQEEGSSRNTSLEPSPRTVEGALVAPLQVHQEEPSGDLGLPSPPHVGGPAGARSGQRVGPVLSLLDLARWKDLQEDTLFPGTKKQNRRSSEEREDWMEEMIISKSFASIHSPRLEEAQRDPATSRTRPEPFRRSPVSGSKSGTRPRFYAELVPFSDSEDHGAPDESALSAHAWSDPWDWFFLEETPPAPALSRGREAPRIRRLEGALGSPWLAQSSPSSSRSMSPSPESTSVPEESLPKSAWTSDEDGREL